VKTESRSGEVTVTQTVALTLALTLTLQGLNNLTYAAYKQTDKQRRKSWWM